MRIHTEEPIEGLRHPNSIHNTADNEGLLKFSAVGKTKSNWTIEKWKVKCMKIYYTYKYAFNESTNFLLWIRIILVTNF